MPPVAHDGVQRELSTMDLDNQVLLMLVGLVGYAPHKIRLRHAESSHMPRCDRSGKVRRELESGHLIPVD